jgi:RNA polymerase sigma factor (sigma-70 family)
MYGSEGPGMSESAPIDWPGDLLPLLPEIQRAIERACERYGAREEKYDIAQNIVLRLLRNQHKPTPRFETRNALFGYVQQAVRNEIPHERKRAIGRGRVQLVEPSLLAQVAHCADPSEMEEMLEQLADERQREACRLLHVSKLAQKEIAERLGVSEPTVSRLLKRAHETLKLKLGQEYGSRGAVP